MGAVVDRQVLDASSELRRELLHQCHGVSVIGDVDPALHGDRPPGRSSVRGGSKPVEHEAVYGEGRPESDQREVLPRGVLFVGTALLARIADPVTALGIHLLLAGSVFVVAGIRQLARAGDRRPFLVAVFVGLLPVAAPAAVGLSPVLFTFYGAAFHVRAEEMDVAKAWQFLASGHVLGTSVVLMLFALACWGYISPLLRRRSLHLLRPLVALTGAMALTLVWGVTVLDGASEAGDTAVRKWRSGRVPGDYYGATPRPVCVTPIGPLEELPMDGHELDPKGVYGSFGAVDGEVTLWDPASGTAFPVPSGAVQILPAGEGMPGASIPRACNISTG